MVQLSASLSNTQMSSLADLKPPPLEGNVSLLRGIPSQTQSKGQCGVWPTKISSFQSLSALLWRSITRARCQPPDQGTSCRHGLQGSIRNYKSALVVIVPGNVRYTGGNWWTSKGKRGGNSLIHSSLSQKLWFIYRQLTDWMMEPYEQNLIHLIIKGLHKAICSASNLQSFSIDFFNSWHDFRMLEEPSSRHILRVIKG
ncbi:unnamed protein product [Malus baccata var. baccata]